MVLERGAPMKEGTCNRCGQPASPDGVCSFCSAPRPYSSPTAAVRKYFSLIGRSPVPALDYSFERTSGGRRSPVPPGMHERARLGKILDDALGRGWLDTKRGRALMAFHGPANGAGMHEAAKEAGETVEGWDQCCRDALNEVRPILGEVGLLEPKKDEPEKEGAKPMAKPERTYRGWEAIGAFLGFSGNTVRAWYSGRCQDPCDIRGAVRRINARVVVATESALTRCWKKLYEPEAE